MEIYTSVTYMKRIVILDLLSSPLEERRNLKLLCLGASWFQIVCQCVTIPKIWTKPKLFSDTESVIFFIPNLLRYEIQYFFIPNPEPSKNEKVSKPRSFETETSPKMWTKLNPKLFPIPNVFDTESNTFCLIPNFFDTESETKLVFEKFWNRNFLNWNVTLCCMLSGIPANI